VLLPVAALLLSLVVGAPAENAAPAPNVWSASGARPWTTCQEYEGEATRRLRAGLPRGEERKLYTVWRARLSACPNVPDALVLMALLEVANPPRVDPAEDFIASLAALDIAYREQREEILRLLAAADLEARRRDGSPPSPSHYLAAYAAIGLGDPARARPLVDTAREAAEVESWRIDRLSALLALAEGDLQTALRLALRAQIHATTAGKPASTYVLALVLDRAGSITAARGLLERLKLREARTLGGLDTLLPVRDRLYLLALDQEARGHNAGAYALWQAYLERDGVEAPEREQVRRRLIELRPAVGIASE